LESKNQQQNSEQMPGTACGTNSTIMTAEIFQHPITRDIVHYFWVLKESIHPSFSVRYRDSQLIKFSLII